MQSWNNERDGKTWSKTAQVDETRPDDDDIENVPPNFQIKT